MMSFFKLDIFTPSNIVAKEMDADSFLIPTVNGQINVLPEHTHVISKLGTGLLTVKKEGAKDENFTVTSGICKVLHNKVTILSTTTERAKDVDPERAKKALEKALKKLKGDESLSDEELTKYERKVSRAEMRIAAAMLK